MKESTQTMGQINFYSKKKQYLLKYHNEKVAVNVKKKEKMT